MNIGDIPNIQHQKEEWAEMADRGCLTLDLPRGFVAEITKRRWEVNCLQEFRY
jgi:hypothetical protein